MSLKIEGLTKWYTKSVQALDHLSFQVSEGECVGIVGESGSGKSTLAKVLVGLESYNHGIVTFNGSPIPPKKREERRKYRRNVQMIFQDPTSTLNPKLPIWKSLLEPLDNFREVTPAFILGEANSRKEIAEQLLELVGLEKVLAHRYPGELSGGQKQRVSIARAISIEPSLLICDEPTASLDATVQVKILELLRGLQKQKKMTILFISHDIRAVSFLCERLIVLKDGVMVDEFSISEMYHKDRHPYTHALIQAASID